ncbi:MAG: hypothetical protein GXP52_00745 [Deltaproteobacteria bacterium]|nr:hypothetical protein [Deltaproteobacteria bacterium]
MDGLFATLSIFNSRRIMVIISLALFLTAVWCLPTATAGEEIIDVSAFSHITGGDVAAAQKSAVLSAKEKAIKAALERILPEVTLQTLSTLIEARVVPQAETFISNYKIESRDVSDLAYSVRLLVAVNADILRKTLASLGIIKEPGSPPLAAVFITMDIPADLDQVKAIGSLANKIFSSALATAGGTVIPPPEGDFEFRYIRPPQSADSLIDGGTAAMADLALGVVIKAGPKDDQVGTPVPVPLSLAYRILDLKSGAVIGSGEKDSAVSLPGRGENPDLDSLGNLFSLMSASLVPVVRNYAVSNRVTNRVYKIVLEGPLDASFYREFTYRLVNQGGDGADIIPDRFSRGMTEIDFWTARAPEEVSALLGKIQVSGAALQFRRTPDGFVVTLPGESQKMVGVSEYGGEVNFYRRLPLPGVENPEDIKKTESVPWREKEDNGTFSTANLAPTGVGILGKIDPARDHDLYRFNIPADTVELTVLVEQTGPGEVEPRVRVFDSTGELRGDVHAWSRGRNLYFVLPVDFETAWIVLSVEDNLGRYSSMFPYVLNLGVKEKAITTQVGNEPS